MCDRRFAQAVQAVKEFLADLPVTLLTILDPRVKDHLDVAKNLVGIFSGKDK
ncbi:hypothetical protein BCF44_106308 [Kutzneria buriramensis]|uniref:Uncharacterized protein n=2 Tax=Kutzneria buriramensis TaxID=1045776 RepID=A0A3E0HKX7_9PSEU|nr:hypothetical protein BCF44_106308 [Kutzneria buriramensis]